MRGLLEPLRAGSLPCRGAVAMGGGTDFRTVAPLKSKKALLTRENEGESLRAAGKGMAGWMETLREVGKATKQNNTVIFSL